MSKFLNLCDYLGVPIADEKTEGPVRTLQLALCIHVLGMSFLNSTTAIKAYMFTCRSRPHA